MTEPDEHVDLVGLVRGELDTAYVALARLHVDGCDECRAELVDVVAGHALLARSATTLATGSRGRRHRTVELDEPLPALPNPRSRWVRVPVLAAAACLAIAAILVGVLRPGDDPAPTPPPVASATLEPLGDTGGGSVEMSEAPEAATRMVIEVHDLPALSSGQFYYAWLLDPATNKMLPLGQVSTAGDAAFELPDALFEAYSAIDVSLEDDDGDPEHSPTSVLRATYP